MNPNMKKSFNTFLEGVCKMYSIPDDAKTLLQEGVNALEEAHFDRTTGEITLNGKPRHDAVVSCIIS